MHLWGTTILEVCHEPMVLSAAGLNFEDRKAKWLNLQ